MALVITLILLSVTLIMALAFLAVSTRERTAITTSTETATARLAADSALAHAEAQIAANILSTTNPYNYGLLVSTNYINPAGFQTAPAATYTSPANVNYAYPDGTALTPADFEQNLANLYYSPRPPVFVTTNSGSPLDFRFYLDLNRNGSYDANGWITNVDNGNNILTNADGSPIVNFQVGDPEWIGVLEHPDAPFGPNNKFIARYLFHAEPIGNGYDLNYIGNEVLDQGLDINADGYFRNEGVGGWEINLPAFLADLNTNEWDTAVAPYNYQRWLTPPVGGFANGGFAFYDAFSLLGYRYNGNYATLAFGPAAFNGDGIDEYSDGNLMTNAVLPFDNDSVTYWAGSDNTNHFFNLSADLFDSSKTSFGVSAVAVNAGNYFSGRLLNAGASFFGGTTNSTYDRYTFYRLLDQLGTDSAPESGKMNLNYDNLDPYVPVAGVTNPPSATNFMAWTPIGFYTNAADRMLRLYTANWLADSFNDYTNTFGAGVTNAFGVTGIPVLVDGRMVYSPAVQRILQLAANIYDATTTNFFPSVFRPVFTPVQNGTNVDIFITSFTPITTADLATRTLPTNPLYPPYSLPADINLMAVGVQNFINIYGVPWIIGAKKGFPNFNQLAMQSTFYIERKLFVDRPTPTTRSALNTSVNQQIFICITNELGVECWNSYASDYKRPTAIFAWDHLQMALTNDISPYLVNYFDTNIITSPINITDWTGTGWTLNNQAYNLASFLLPISTSIATVPEEIYQFPPAAGAQPNLNTPFQHINQNGQKTPVVYYQPHWGLNTTNNLQVVMIDTASGQVIDYVQLNGPNTNRDITSELSSNIQSTNQDGGMWNILRQTTTAQMPYGIANQIDYSQTTNSAADLAPGDTGTWDNTYGTPSQEIAYFDKFYGLQPPNGIPATNNSLTEMQVPFTPYKLLYSHTIWQANDPLVHYLASDLTYPLTPGGHDNPLISRVTNLRYQPWGATMISLQNADTNTYNPMLKDPLVWSSDFWDFPTNKFPTVGWLGRVHRGTPWQTVYLKANNILGDFQVLNSGATNYIGTNTWANWTGDSQTSFGRNFDAANSGPLQDRYLFDLFTTAPNDNATRGQLPVNQVHFPAWSALFSGMIVPTNLSGGYTVINPGGVLGTGSAVFQMFDNITSMRSTYTNTTSTGGAFKHIGDVLSARTLTDESPFLPWNDPSGVPQQNGISDELYEWLPQQMMSLLKVSTVPRYVIYSYGQTLAPAGANAVVTGGNFSGMVTNYQVVAETVTRAVVRIEGAPTNTHAVIESFNIMPPQ